MLESLLEFHQFNLKEGRGSLSLEYLPKATKTLKQWMLQLWKTSIVHHIVINKLEWKEVLQSKFLSHPKSRILLLTETSTTIPLGFLLFRFEIVSIQDFQQTSSLPLLSTGSSDLPPLPPAPNSLVYGGSTQPTLLSPTATKPSENSPLNGDKYGALVCYEIQIDWQSIQQSESVLSFLIRTLYSIAEKYQLPIVILRTPSLTQESKKILQAASSLSFAYFRSPPPHIPPNNRSKKNNSNNTKTNNSNCNNNNNDTTSTPAKTKPIARPKNINFAKRSTKSSTTQKKDNTTTTTTSSTNSLGTGSGGEGGVNRTDSTKESNEMENLVVMMMSETSVLEQVDHFERLNEENSVSNLYTFVYKST